MTQPIKNKIIDELESLNQAQQKKLLDYALNLKRFEKQAANQVNLTRFAGIIPQEDLAIMEKAIEEDCEKVDLNGW